MAFMCKHGNKECNGCRECSGGRIPVEPECPVCGSVKCDFFIEDRHGNIVGCEDCLRKVDVYE